MISTEQLIAFIAGTTSSRREELWVRILKEVRAKSALEIGVWKGAFAEHMLKQCSEIERYYMLDPWQHLDHWNKPWNVDQQKFDAIHIEAMSRTNFAQDRRIVLRGTTTAMIDQIPDDALDVAYIDGDHTLRGITIDLTLAYAKVRPGGILGGDDYTRSIWEHGENFEPSLVCPFAAYFAESQKVPIVILPHSQFAIIKVFEPGRQFQVIDTTQSYGERTLLPQARRRP